jgi:hypothetical protein
VRLALTPAVCRPTGTALERYCSHHKFSTDARVFGKNLRNIIVVREVSCWPALSGTLTPRRPEILTVSGDRVTHF